ncbi:hypothetical protein [Rheinheimera fenheensis]|uniref:hypothetical protein n=1 Tax=Rheinheimera fenheensis TaxID=3152295 RepID=UPI00325E8E67
MNTMIKPSRTLLLTGALFFSTVASAQQQLEVQQTVPNQITAQQQQQKDVVVQPSAEVAKLTMELMADVQHQLSSSIRAEVNNAVAGLTDSLKQVLSR